MQKKDFKLYLSLICYTLLPSIYLLVRMNIISVQNVDINIMGQMEWFNLIDEVLVTTLTVPLYFLLKPESQKNKNGFVFLMSFAIYAIFTALIMAHIGFIASYMNAENAEQYLFMQALAMLAGFVSTFMVMLFVLNTDDSVIWKVLIVKLIMQAACDWICISKFGDVGAAYSEIITNACIGLITVLLAIKKKYLSFSIPSKIFFRQWMKIGLFAGVQIFLDNFIYAIMVCKMVNAVSESGNYWVANNFIWGWLLVPVTCMVEVVKKNNLNKLTKQNVWKYALMICCVWICTMPVWNRFISGPMATDAEMVLQIVTPLIPFYFCYIVSAVIDGWFVSKGRTIYNAINSLIVNVGYYGIIYVMYRYGIFTMSMQFIIRMFGFGMVVHMIASVIMYIVCK